MKLSSLMILAFASVVSAAPARDPGFDRAAREIYAPNPDFFPDHEGNRKTGWNQFTDKKLVSIAGIQTWWESLMTVAGPPDTEAGDK